MKYPRDGVRAFNQTACIGRSVAFPRSFRLVPSTPIFFVVEVPCLVQTFARTTTASDSMPTPKYEQYLHDIVSVYTMSTLIFSGEILSPRTRLHTSPNSQLRCRGHPKTLLRYTRPLIPLRTQSSRPSSTPFADGVSCLCPLRCVNLCWLTTAPI